MKNNDNKNIVSFIKELYKTPRGRGILFFAAYFVFFVVLIILVRTGERGNTAGTYETVKSYHFSVNDIASNNYNFSHSINLDDKTFTYSGSRYFNEEVFVFSDSLNTLEYYRNDNNYLSKTGDLWLKSDNPYLFPMFFEIQKINEILDKATYISKTDYESGRKVYHFEVSTTTLVSLLENKNVDLDDLPNEVVVTTNEEGDVTEIKLVLNSYCQYQGSCSLGLQILLKYSDYGKIQEIASPID